MKLTILLAALYFFTLYVCAKVAASEDDFKPKP